MDISYAIAPFLSWLIAGSLKFAVNSCRARRLAFALIGYGGFPSNHSAIVSSMAALIAFKEGIGHPAFGAALAFAFIVVLDAVSLRNQVGRHAAAINLLTQVDDNKRLRERMGHTAAEIIGGVIVGIATAGLLYMLPRLIR